MVNMDKTTVADPENTDPEDVGYAGNHRHKEHRMNLIRVTKKMFTTWGRQFTGKYDKLIAYGIILLLSTFSLLTCFLNWAAYHDLTRADLGYGLVTSAPKPLPLLILLAFCIAGIAGCIVECFNILTIMINGGHAMVPVELEQSVLLLAVDIPVAATHLSVVMCRSDAATHLQVAACMTAVIRSGLRMYFYGYIKERLFKYERSMYKWTVKIAVYVTASVAWVMLFLTTCFLCNHARVANGILHTRPGRDGLFGNVSIALLSEEFMPFTIHGKIPETTLPNATKAEYMQTQNHTMLSDEEMHQYILADKILTDIPDIGETGRYTSKKNPAHSYAARFDCRKTILGRDFRPSECTGAGNRPVNQLVFRFRYSYSRRRRTRQPLGEVEYSVGVVSVTGSKTACEALSGPLTQGWDLHYVKVFDRYHNNTLDPIATIVSPWPGTCTATALRYQPNMDPCD